jgi:hypothetical protein
MDRVYFEEKHHKTDLYTVEMDTNNITPPSDKSKKYPGEDGPHKADIDLKREVNMAFVE